MAAITLTLDDAEQQAFNQLLDTALRSTGLTAFQLVAHFSARLQAAQAAAAMPPRQAQGDNPE
jgi:hypothetical protein